MQIMRLRIECQQLEKETREREGSRDKCDMRLNTSKLHIPFDERKDDFDAYIRRFESLAKNQKWPEGQWSTALATCLSGEVLRVYGRLPRGDAADYSKVKTALLKRFRFTADGFRNKFNLGRPADGETAAEFSARLSHYFDR
uniref:Retrotransposon gag domain-containing protein n=1 Tax=Amblyomma parvum TaxID=251391 RepID=A0A023FXJ4_AMBPA